MTAACFRPGFLGSMLLLAWAHAAGAQPAPPSLDRLRLLADAVWTVTVVDTHGREVRGTIADVSASELALRIGREVRWFAAADVHAVRVRKDDSLANGALIGAVVGGGSAVVGFLDNECHDDTACYQAVAITAGLGALAGLGLDALIRDEAIVYSAETPRPQALRLGPIAGRGRKGVRLTIAF